ncbi:MAG: ROK family protein [Desulfuromonadaceae bacterium]
MDQVGIGIDLGGTNCRAGLVSAEGLVGPMLHMATGKNLSYPLFLDQLAALWELPVRVVNDANAICWGEALFGAGMEFSSFITITLGTGVGGGLVLDRHIWRGADGTAGEIGHVTVVPDGRLCGCGNRGCLEQYASASALVRGVRERLIAGQSSPLLESQAELNSSQVAAAARAGDPMALAVMAEAGRALGTVLAGVANLLNLEGVVIAGGASGSFDLLQPILQDELQDRAFAVPGRRLRIVLGNLGDVAGILGAADLARENLPLTDASIYG